MPRSSPTNNYPHESEKTQFLLDQICEQQKWIEKCEQNPASSYYGKNAAAVRRADLDALRKLALRKYRSSKQIEAHPGVDEVMITTGRAEDRQVIVYIAEGWNCGEGTSTVVGEKIADVALGVALIERGEVC